MSQQIQEEQADQKKANLITFADGVVTLGEAEVPGVLRDLRVDGKVRFDEQKVDGTSGKKKTPQGFEDSDIMMSFILGTDSETNCYDKLETVAGMFRSVDDKTNPKIYTWQTAICWRGESGKSSFPNSNRLKTTRRTKLR